ncbi:MAG TPA: TlpA disulfide reductase family protein [Candidatus Deferrimicrobiaceae bacterium]|nr:TlpA disulfide reductase family protein [Candidatus Deferrimicrobiaceae bacterium]
MVLHRWGRFGTGVVALLLSAFAFAAPASALEGGLRNGDPVPDRAFVGITVDSGKLSSFSGEKGLIVVYWTTWDKLSPAFLAFAGRELRRYEEHGVKLLAVNADHPEMRDEDTARVRAKAAEMKLSFPVVLDAALKGSNEIGIAEFPTMLLLDGDRKIVDAYAGFSPGAREEILRGIDAYLGIGKKAPAKAGKKPPGPPVPPPGAPGEK